MFRFEHTHKFKEAEYVALHGPFAIQGTARWLRWIAMLLLGLVCLLSRYTFLLGVVVLVLGAIVLLMPRWAPGTTARGFREFRYLREPVTYGADSTNVWVKTTDFRAEAAWRHLVTWRERSRWLILQGSGFPQVVFPIAALKAAGAYEPVKALAKEHGVEFASRAGRKRRLTKRSGGPAAPAAER